MQEEGKHVDCEVLNVFNKCAIWNMILVNWILQQFKMLIKDLLTQKLKLWLNYQYIHNYSFKLIKVLYDTVVK